MEFLRDEDKVDSLTETSNDADKPIFESGSETESRPGDPAVELETPEAWPDNQGRDKRETNGKRLRWLHIIGKNYKYQKGLFNSNFREEDSAFICAPCQCDLYRCCSNFLF